MQVQVQIRDRTGGRGASPSSALTPPSVLLLLPISLVVFIRPSPSAADLCPISPSPPAVRSRRPPYPPVRSGAYIEMKVETQQPLGSGCGRRCRRRRGSPPASASRAPILSSVRSPRPVFLGSGSFYAVVWVPVRVPPEVQNRLGPRCCLLLSCFPTTFDVGQATCMSSMLNCVGTGALHMRLVPEVLE